MALFDRRVGFASDATRTRVCNIKFCVGTWCHWELPLWLQHYRKDYSIFWCFFWIQTSYLLQASGWLVQKSDLEKKGCSYIFDTYSLLMIHRMCGVWCVGWRVRWEPDGQPAYVGVPLFLHITHPEREYYPPETSIIFRYWDRMADSGCHN